MKRKQKPISVLIVEDDSVNRMALVWILSDLGFDPIEVGNLADARTALRDNNPDIVILDLNLPDGDGTSLLAEIRESNLPIKVAVVTGVTDELRLHEVTALQPDALFGKPFDLEDFDNWLVKQLSDFSLSVRNSKFANAATRSNRSKETLAIA